ncbi:uncharacterized protein BCR38DRAFT_407119 [Pseudomassariella vexata]|uniref:Uncharacterized protein n=1 Tax=Pseudomassariella vexata TaxID=1141098 RepID=A0A1Y2E758_9PEZI|nr:uncharacterized protein BCR38DRAFT_407119 [Pseudomassariella vexata]ORY67106.1 hypothetical protein BCR38DRAFT_407119 [Pseudomassariella vexata]
MDPLSIATSCLALLTAVGKTSFTITHFVRRCREAPTDRTAARSEQDSMVQRYLNCATSYAEDSYEDLSHAPAPDSIHEEEGTESVLAGRNLHGETSNDHQRQNGHVLNQPLTINKEESRNVDQET